MKRLFFLGMLFFLPVSLTFSQQTNKPATQQNTPAVVQQEITPTPVANETVTLSGDIIDNLCANANKADLANFVKTHTKECALMSNCAASGYSIFADGQLYKFDKDSNAQIENFLKKEDSKLQVTVIATKVDNELKLISVENQK